MHAGRHFLSKTIVLGRVADKDDSNDTFEVGGTSSQKDPTTTWYAAENTGAGEEHMQYIKVVGLVLGILGAAHAETYTLDEVLRIASEKSDQVKVIAYQYEAGRQQVKFYRSEAWPMVSFDLKSNYASVSKEGLGGLGGGIDSTTSSFLPERINSYRHEWSIILAQPLLTFGRVSNALALAGTQDSVLELTREMQTDLLFLSVMQAFTEAYLAQQQVSIAEKSASSAEKLLQRMRVEVENGAGSQLDLLRVEAQYGGAKAALLTARSQSEIAIRRLSQSAGLEADTGYTLVVDESSTGASFDDPTQGRSAEYLLKGFVAKLRHDQADYERSKYFPSIYLSGAITNSKDYIENIDENFKDGINPSNTALLEPRFYTYAIGLNVTWTLFDGFRRNASIAQARAQAYQAEVEQKQIKDKNEIAVAEARDRLVVIDESMEAVSAQRAAAQRAMNLVEQDYGQGFVDITTYLQTEQQLREAEKRYYELRMQRLLTIAQLRFNLGLPVYEES